MLQHYLSERAIRWLFAISLLVFAFALSACGGDSSRANAQESQVAVEPANASGTTVNVTAVNFEYALDQREVSAGEVTFVIENASTDMAHDFAIQIDGVEQKSAILPPGKSTSLTVTLEPGTYTYRCTIPGHEILGVKGSFTVR